MSEEHSNALDRAADLTRRGFAVIPVPHREKGPRTPGWQNMRLALEDLPNHFSDALMNIGFLCGEPSGGVADVDLDHPRAVELADQYLPATAAEFGRASKPRSHRLYRLTRPVPTRRWATASGAMIVELRSTGCQTVAPGSTHPSGESVEWSEDGEPAEIDAETLIAAVEALANAVRGELGETPQTQRLQQAPQRPRRAAGTTAYAAAALRQECEGVATTGEGGRNSRLNQAAFSCGTLIGAGVLDQEEAQRELTAAGLECGLDRQEVDRTIASGIAAGIENPREIADNKIIIDPRHTPPIARWFITAKHTSDDGARLLHHHMGAYTRHRGAAYAEVEEDGIRRELYEYLEHELPSDSKRPIRVNATFVSNVMDAVAAQTHLPADIAAPAWLVPQEGLPPAKEVVACRSRLLHLPTMQFMEPTPQFFVTSALEFDPTPDAPTPTRWHAFLDDIFEHDPEQRDVLQEIFGYLLTADTAQQKIFLIVGPKRSGKGTIARVLTALIGAANVAGPTTSSLAGSFGLQSLIGKSLAIISDARFRGEGVPTAIERLLAISGEDAITIDRKHREAVTAKLAVRFLILSNELPRLADASEAIASRFLILTLQRSFYGVEDHNLTPDLLAELPGIFLWAVEGWRRLQARGRFIQPQAGVEAQEQIEELASPVGAFVREMCVVAPGFRIAATGLYGAWREWCEAEGREAMGTRQSFGRDLAAAVPGIQRRRGSNNEPFYQGIALRSTLRAVLAVGEAEHRHEPSRL